ncbi:hypothetical protein [Prosthecobacter sp.]|uniref:F0F1 ATP synthase subunit B family protein n=1 Tax=Prosthecobacter sp. TaxID=1965333 RepID=UPI002488B42A|nr:hypothetical protein [Prosthecobacter sp.]MDI1314735.1 hypothetical protein [Prosthecobacter sp.]
MLIDWFTVGAQTLNFLILVWLMKRYLYQPVLKAIDAREKRIAAQIADAEAKEATASKEREEFQNKNADFDKQRADMLTKVADEAKTERQRLIEEARKAADAVTAKREESLRNDAQNLSEAVAQRAQTEVFAIARKTLNDLAGANLEERISEVFMSRLRSLDDEAKGRLGAALKQATEPAVVRTAFELPEAQRALIRNAINETFSIDARLTFETAPNLVSGIELTANGQKVAWSIGDYLKSLERGVGEVLNGPAKPKDNPVAASS